MSPKKDGQTDRCRSQGEAFLIPYSKQLLDVYYYVSNGLWDKGIGGSHPFLGGEIQTTCTVKTRNTKDLPAAVEQFGL